MKKKDMGFKLGCEVFVKIEQCSVTIFVGTFKAPPGYQEVLDF
jgi:hypothetical protein